MTLLLDAGAPRRYLHLLREWGYPVELSVAHIPHDAPDSDVIDLASTLNAALLTVDMDFSNILEYPPSKYKGIIVLRYQPADEHQIDAALKVMLDDLYAEGLMGYLVIVSPGRYRVRR
jgi:predicted nuclease of predicted toxin-antitoxin system